MEEGSGGLRGPQDQCGSPGTLLPGQTQRPCAEAGGSCSVPSLAASALREARRGQQAATPGLGEGVKYFAPTVKTCSKYQLCEFGKDPGGIFEMLHASKKFLISSSSAAGGCRGGGERPQEQFHRPPPLPVSVRVLLGKLSLRFSD